MTNDNNQQPQEYQPQNNYQQPQEYQPQQQYQQQQQPQQQYQQQQQQQYQQPQQQPQQQMVQQKSGGSGCLKGCLITFVIVAVLIVAGIFGVKMLINAVQPKLTENSKNDVISFYDKLGLENDDNTPSVEDIMRGNYIATGTIHVDTVFTSEEITSVLNDTAGSSDLFENISVKFVNNDEIEVVANISDEIDEIYELIPELENFDFAIEMIKNTAITYKGKVEYDQENGFSFDVDKLKVGAISLPKKLIVENKDSLETQFNQIISNIQGLNIESVDFEDNNMKFVGDIPAELDKN